MNFSNILKKSLFIFVLLLEFGLVTPCITQAADDRKLPDFNQVGNAQSAALSMINNPNRNVIDYAVKNSISKDHSFTHHTESYFYTDDPEVFGKIVRAVINNPESSLDNIHSHHSRQTFELHKTFTKEEAEQLVGRDVIGHDSRTNSDTNRVVVVIAYKDLASIGHNKWRGGIINTAFPENK